MESEEIDHEYYQEIINSLTKENKDLRRKLKTCVMILNQIGNRASTQANKVKKNTKLSLD